MEDAIFVFSTQDFWKSMEIGESIFNRCFVDYFGQDELHFTDTAGVRTKSWTL